METTRLEVPVRGMTCASCVSRIEKGLQNAPGVDEARVHLASERAIVTYDSEQVSIDEVVTAICDLGYEGRTTGPSTPCSHSLSKPELENFKLKS